MKLLIITLLVAAAAADVSHILPQEHTAQIVKQELDMGNEGQYVFSYQTSDGISASEQGALKKPPSGDPFEVVQGEYSYTAPNGELVKLSYVADEDGFQPQGSHIPTSPPIPEPILRALDYISKNPPRPAGQQ